LKFDSSEWCISAFRVLSRRPLGYLGCLDVEALAHYVNGYVIARGQAAAASSWLAGSLPEEAMVGVMERFASWLDPSAKHPAWISAVRTIAAARGRETESALVAIELFDRYLKEKEGTSLVETASRRASASPPRAFMRLEEAVERARPGNQPDLVPVVALWVGIGWVVAFQTTAYVDTGASTALAVERAQLVSVDGECVRIGGPEPWTVSLVRLARTAGSEARLEPWVRELAERHEALGPAVSALTAPR
jgi:hypothetical protein